MPAEEFKDLQPVLEPLKCILAEHRQPGLLPERYKSAEGNIAHLLSHTKHNGPLNRAAEMGKLEDLVSKLDASLALLEGQAWQPLPHLSYNEETQPEPTWNDGRRTLRR